MRDERYKGNSSIDMNSAEINRLAYGPEMNAHIDRLKAHRKSKDASSRNDIGKEFADHINFQHKKPVTVALGPVKIFTPKPKFCCVCGERALAYTIKQDGKVYGDCHKYADKPARLSIPKVIKT